MFDMTGHLVCDWLVSIAYRHSDVRVGHFIVLNMAGHLVRYWQHSDIGVGHFIVLDMAGYLVCNW